jgi:RHS repeat-associated protein
MNAALIAVSRAAVYASLVLVFLSLGASRAAAQTESVEYYGYDAVGSVRVVFNAAGGVAGRGDYLPFGEEWSTSSGLANERFLAKPRDGETGLDYSGARYYDPALGRFTAADPVVPGPDAMTNPQLWNRYAYAGNNPFSFSDPDGRQIFIAFQYCDFMPCRNEELTVHGVGGYAWTPYISEPRFGGGGGGGRGGGGRGPRPAPAKPAEPDKPTDPAPEKEPEKPKDPETPEDPCGKVPDTPLGVYLKDNIAIAEKHKIGAWIDRGRKTYVPNKANEDWFYNMVRNAKGRFWDVASGASWDYKQLGPQYEKFGNFNFGATGRAAGYSAAWLKTGSTYAHVKSHWFLDVFSMENVGNEAIDHAVIDEGVAYYDAKCHAK